MNQYEFDRLMEQVDSINVVETRQHDDDFVLPPTQSYVLPPTQAYAIPPAQAYVIPSTQDFAVPSTPRTPILRKR